MKLSPFLIIPALLLSGTAFAAKAPAIADPAPAARVQAHVEFLASDLLEGRGTGTRGHEIAAEYVAAQFRAMGLKPGGEKGSWYQWVPLRRATTIAANSRVTINSGKGPVAIEAGHVVVQPSLTEKTLDLTAPLLFVGYGLDDPRSGFNDYAGLDARGKIVVYFRGVPKGPSSDVAAHLGGYKDAIAARHGAIGSIAISANEPKKPNDPLPPFAAFPVTNWVDGAGGAGGTLPGMRVSLSISAATARTLFDGADMSLADARKAAADKTKPVRGFALKPTLTIHGESTWEDFKSPEVIGLLPGSDPALKAEHIVLMGHLDHLGLKKNAKPGEDAIYNGALDNAAGVATMIEAAQQFVDSPKRPRRSVLFIAHTGEELGLIGADYFSLHPTVPAGSIVGGVDLDMPVSLYDFTDVTAFGADHSTMAQTVAEAGRTMGISVSPDPMPEEAIFTRSDHYRLVERGIPAILLMTGYANGGKAKWDDFFKSRYHQLNDDLKQPISWTALARYAELNYRISRRLADADQRPLWYQGNYFGDLFAPGTPRAPLPKVKP